MASKIKVDQIQTADGTGTIALQNQLSGMTNLSLPTGSVLQVVSATKTDTWTYTGSTTLQDVTGLAATITPTSSSSKILVQVSLTFTASGRYSGARLLRGSTHIGGGASSGSRSSVNVSPQANEGETGNAYVLRTSSFSYLDSPSTTSATTYKIQAGNPYDAAITTYVNRIQTDSDAAWSQRGSSTITVMEIAG